MPKSHKIGLATAENEPRKKKNSLKKWDHLNVTGGDLASRHRAARI
jgi:hypothetical protein